MKRPETAFIKLHEPIGEKTHNQFVSEAARML